jgi:hypothetical protein
MALGTLGLKNVLGHTRLKDFSAKFLATLSTKLTKNGPIRCVAEAVVLAGPPIGHYLFSPNKRRQMRSRA